MHPYIHVKANKGEFSIRIGWRRARLRPRYFSVAKRRQVTGMALVLSILLHMLVLLWVVNHPITEGVVSNVEGKEGFTVHLANPLEAKATIAPIPQVAPPPVQTSPEPKPLPKATPNRPIATLNSHSPLNVPKLPPLPPILPSPPSNNAQTFDMMARVRAARERRSAEDAQEIETEKQEAGETESERQNRVALANMPGNGSQNIHNKTGGVFEVTHMGIHDAVFVFYGWNNDFRRDWSEQFEVSQGNNRTIELAIVNQMIAIIRRYETKEFLWNSHRLNRTVRLSAREEDTAGLQDFLIEDFFATQPQNPAQRR